MVFVYTCFCKSTSLHSGEAHTLEASCMQDVTSQSIAEQQTDPKRRFLWRYTIHILKSVPCGFILTERSLILMKIRLWRRWIFLENSVRRLCALSLRWDL